MAQSELSINGANIAYDVRGEGLAVMLVHGLGFTRRSWTKQTEVLLGAGYRVITMDLRGFGGSGEAAKPYRMEELADDIEAVREAGGAERMHLVGHSMGAMAAQCYAINHPTRLVSLFLASTTSHNGRRGKAFAEVLSILSRRGFDVAREDQETWSAVERILAEVLPFVGPVVPILEKLTKRPDPGRARAWEAIAGFSAKDRIGAIKCPCTVIHGTNDANIPFIAGKLAADAIGGSLFVPVEGAEHNLPLEQSELFNRCLLEHLERAQESQSSTRS